MGTSYTVVRKSIKRLH